MSYLLGIALWASGGISATAFIIIVTNITTHAPKPCNCEELNKGTSGDGPLMIDAGCIFAYDRGFEAGKHADMKEIWQMMYTPSGLAKMRELQARITEKRKADAVERWEGRKQEIEQMLAEGYSLDAACDMMKIGKSALYAHATTDPAFDRWLKVELPKFKVKK